MNEEDRVGGGRFDVIKSQASKGDLLDVVITVTSADGDIHANAAMTGLSQEAEVVMNNAIDVVGPVGIRDGDVIVIAVKTTTREEKR